MKFDKAEYWARRKHVAVEIDEKTDKVISETPKPKRGQANLPAPTWFKKLEDLEIVKTIDGKVIILNRRNRRHKNVARNGNDKKYTAKGVAHKINKKPYKQVWSPDLTNKTRMKIRAIQRSNNASQQPSS